VVYKGFRTVLAFKDRCMVINSGNSALAKAGTGDVLTGMIGSMLAQGLETLQGTATAVYVHGRLADEWVRTGNDKSTLVASDLTHYLPQLISRLSGGTLF
jgi:NAD(P)H-hydrate epimerase